MQAMRDGFTHYSATQGWPELRKLIAEDCSRSYSADYTMNDVIVTPGIKSAVYFTLAAILEPKDEIILISPYYVSYPAMVKLAEPTAKIVNVTLNRKITEGFNTVVLPFDLNAEQVQTLFGTDAKVYAFSENSDDPEDVTVSFNTVAEGTIAANQPVLVDATQASTSNSIMGVTVAYDAEPLATGRNVDFVGLYAPTTVPENDYFIAQGAIYKSKGETSIKSFRAFLKTKTGVAGIKLYIDDVEDGIQTLSDANENGVNIYNVAGQRMSKTQKGINIVNGKKVIVK